MNNIPKKLREELSKDDFYKRCALRSRECSGRITWEHAIYYAGKQVQERWAIIPICEYHHSVGKFQNGGGLNKRKNEWVAFNRLFSSDKEYLIEMKKKYPKAFLHWKHQVLFLNKIYGRY